MSVAEYYAFHPDYYKLQELRTLILSDKCQEAIDFMRANNLSVNSYLSGLRKETWVPVIHLACLSAKREGLVRYLLLNGADVSLRPDGRAPHILAACHDKYLHNFIRRSPGVVIDDKEHVCDILRRGSGQRITQLLRAGIIPGETLRSIEWEEIMLSGIRLALSYLFYRYSQEGAMRAFTDETMVKYSAVAALAKLHGWVPGHEFLQLCADYYLYELLQDIELPGKRPPVIYHPQMDRLLVATFRPLLNDRRYEETCRAMGQEVDPELYNSNIMN